MKSTICILLLLLVCGIDAAADNIGLSTVVIDAGHGGKDPGSVSKDKKTYEKTITLDIAKTLADQIKTAYPNLNVILTRDKDVFVSLNDRAEIANKADADLFISIHINSTTSTSPNGFSIHTLGQSSNSNKDYLAYNMDVCKRENSVILLEEDYSTNYQGFDPNDPESYIFMLLMQNSYLEQSIRFSQVIQKNLKGSSIKADRGVWQNAFYVLWKTAMPSVLVELGFISNQNDLAALKIKNNRDDLAKRLFNSFKEYKQLYDASIGANPNAKADASKLAAAQDVKNKTEKKTETAKKTNVVSSVEKNTSDKNAKNEPAKTTVENKKDQSLFPGNKNTTSSQTANQSSSKAETTKVETAKVETAKVETAKVEPAKSETTETAKVETKKPEATKTGTTKVEPAKSEILYAVQIFVTSNNLDSKDKRFLGYTPKIIKSGNSYKYFISVVKTEAELKKNYVGIKAKYPDSFMVTIENEKINRLK